MRMLASGLFAVALALPAVPARAATARSCSDLAKLALPHATITVATSGMVVVHVETYSPRIGAPGSGAVVATID